MSVSDCPTLLSKQPGIGHPVLYSGSRFRGEQKNLNKATSYEVEVILQHVNLEKDSIAGYLSITGLVEDVPTLTTFFEGEIIGRHHPFLTRKWDADEEVDKKQWNKFPKFQRYAKSFNSDDFDYGSLALDDAIFMRWKEQFLVPDHTVTSIRGASYAGFYYLCCLIPSATIEGYYHYRTSDCSQSLSLKHVPQGSFGVFEFR
jgi:hypothetical protein